jgi:lysophospholipase L1-like esterase
MNTLKWHLIAVGMVLLQSGCTTTTNRSQTSAIPAFGDGARILFQGDSITDGNRGRNSDPNHILGHGYQTLISSRYGADLPERHLIFMNRGISGNTVSALARRWQSDTIELKPDLLSILIGVNDLSFGVSAERYEQQYDQLLADTLKALPKVRLVLCEPFGLPVGQKTNNWETYRAQIGVRDRIVNKLGEKYHAPVVPLQQMFENATNRAPAEYWIWDGIHPTYAGHQLMADEWVRTVRAYWPEPQPANPAPVGKVAPRPLYRDPPFDAPTDPVICFNAESHKWFMYYADSN